MVDIMQTQRRIRHIERHQLPYYLKVFNRITDKPMGSIGNVSLDGLMLISQLPMLVGARFDLRLKTGLFTNFARRRVRYRLTLFNLALGKTPAIADANQGHFGDPIPNSMDNAACGNLPQDIFCRRYGSFFRNCSFSHWR